MTQKVQDDPVLPLAELPCFTRLDPDLLKVLRSRAVEKRCPKGTVLVREGSVLEHVVILRAGRLRLYCVDDEGQERTCRLVAPGECFCFAPCHQRFPSPVTIECMEDSRIAMLSRGLLGRLVAPIPFFTEGTIQCLSSRLTDLMRASAGGRRSVRERLAEVLIELAARNGVRSPDGVLLQGLTHEELAALAGTAREVITRALRRFSDEGLLSTGREKVLIRNLPRLAEVRGTGQPSL